MTVARTTILATPVVICLLISPAGAREGLETELPTITPGRTMTLREALASADARNLTLEALRVEIDKAEAQLLQAVGLVTPMATAGLQYVRADHEDTVDFNESMTQELQPILDQLGVVLPPSDSEPVVVRKQDDLKAQVSVAMPLVNLKSWFAVSAARQGRDVARMSVEEARQRLLEGTAKAYYVALMSRSLVELHESQVRAAEHHLDFASKRFESGSGLKIDVVRASTDLASARGELVNAHLSLDTSRDALGVLTGAGGLPMPAAVPALPDPESDELESDESVLERRLDVRLGEARTHLARRRFGTSWSTLIPTVDMAWAWSYQFTDLPTFGSLDKSRWNLVFNLNLPLFQLFSVGEIMAARADVRVAEIKAEETRIDAAKEIRQARRDLRAANTSLTIAKRQAELAREAAELAVIAYEAGAGSSLDVTDAHRTVTAAEVNLATARLKAQIALVTLYRATGTDLLSVVR